MIPGREGVGIRGEVLKVQPQPEKNIWPKSRKFLLNMLFFKKCWPTLEIYTTSEVNFKKNYDPLPHPRPYTPPRFFGLDMQRYLKSKKLKPLFLKMA